MQKQISHAEAWIDFYSWIKKHESWRIITRREKQYMQLADWHFKKGRLGHVRIKTILSKYAPDRYSFHEIIYLNK